MVSSWSRESFLWKSTAIVVEKRLLGDRGGGEKRFFGGFWEVLRIASGHSACIEQD
jgi:hypothetical protein